MGILRRDQRVILGLSSKLKALEESLTNLANQGGLTDAQNRVLSLISATQSVNLDDVVLTSALAGNIADTTADSQVATVAAIRQYVLAALQVKGPSCIIETLTVMDGRITLNHRPHSGMGGILNFARVLLDQNGQQTYYRLVATQDPYRFNIDAQGAVIEGLAVEVQYLYYLDARDLNDLIGEMILDGLVLVEAPETTTSE